MSLAAQCTSGATCGTVACASVAAVACRAALPPTRNSP
eukprot:CAMPEP_0196773826 /NCGR_PEP_ID=MMETSP1104-20130614/3005_1 /TAXON_ID=33652 /ORGANISM="Cafeteria sp., Strain Caron Lab Isolate" /LENGTH=37 /DNA_ID= /DNA_START= /DNA_END= /DNA_ORIENTATION=